MRRLLLAGLIGLALTLATGFLGGRTSSATYPDIMGCESGCPVAASGWPFVFVRDYTGMSVVGKADLMEVWLAGDRFDWAGFIANGFIWSSLALGGLGLLRQRS